MFRKKKPIYTKKWFWITILFLVILGKIVNIDSDPQKEVASKIAKDSSENVTETTGIIDDSRIQESDNTSNQTESVRSPASKQDVKQKSLGDLLKSNNNKLGDSLSNFTSYYGQNYKSNNGFPMYGDFDLVLSESMNVVQGV
ncbi:hypothetical protein [Paenibacillus sp. FSL R10-2734]|uniref:hypothetical protein n=1 Tax=Paenibacillus sp. FSL R10-2734 TaxID=2954691 RepID=UPI0030DB583A